MLKNEKQRDNELVERLKNVISNQEKEIESFKKEINELRFERYFFKTLMDNVPDTIYFKDRESKFTRINKAQANLLGVKDPSDSIGKSDFDYFLEEHAKNAYNDEQEIIKTKKRLVAKEEKITNSKGESRYVTATKVPIIDNEGKVQGIVGITRDISENKEAEEKILEYTKELQYLNASKDKFFSIIAHDLKNPFSSLLGCTDILVNEKENLTENEKDELVTNISQSCKHTYHLLENLLHWSRAHTGRIDYCPKVFDINIAVNESIAILENQAAKKKVELISELPKDLYVYADVNMIETVLRNLITNAIKFSDIGKNIVISAGETERGDVLLNITDTGVGIAEKDLKKLFKIDTTHTTLGTDNEVGSGLGLILCKEFIEKNGGKISVKSKVGKGSTFTFLLHKKPFKSD